MSTFNIKILPKLSNIFAVRVIVCVVRKVCLPMIYNMNEYPLFNQIFTIKPIRISLYLRIKNQHKTSFYQIILNDSSIV